MLGALGRGEDVWGDALLRAPGGPTYEGARRYLTPLLLARGPGKRPLTLSGVYYVPFAMPLGADGAGSVALHVADGSQILADRVGGQSLTVGVGARGAERYGTCLSRLATPALYGGYLPVLQTRYADGAGARYRQESFAARVPETRSLVSFVRLEADAPPGAAATLRLSPSPAGLAAAGNRLVRDGRTYAFFSPGGAFDGSALTYAVPPGTTRTVYLAWLGEPAASRGLTLDRARYEAARRSVAAYWDSRLAEGAEIVVPERRVLDAERSLLIQELGLTWRYSVGNAYEEFSFPESLDIAQVVGEYGFDAVGRAILRTSYRRRPAPYPNWRMGEKLLASASYVRLAGDRRFLAEATPVLRGYVAKLGRQIDGARDGLLRRERYSSDIPDSVYGLHSQAVVWQSLRSIARDWDETGRAALAGTCRRLAARLETGLRRAVRASQRSLSDGSLFVPVRLLDGERPYGALTEARLGSYWNLVMPYALASGLFAPGGAEAAGVLRYVLRHGSHLLGLVRAGAYALYPSPVYPVSGTDEVYGLNMARFLADEDLPDQLVLSLYGQLAAGMTPGTFVSGEGATVAPLAGAYYRSMYQPPNSASNAAFLEKLRLLLVHETVDRNGDPNGLQLAYAVPRTWLGPGRRIQVRRLPTSFGPVSFSIAAAEGSVRISLDVPGRTRVRALSLRLRLPAGEPITSVALDGRRFTRFDPAAETIDLSGETGRLELLARYAGRS